MSGANWVIERINGHPIPQEEMLEYAEEIYFLKPDERDFEDYAIAAIRLFAPDKDKAFSAQFRIEALETFLFEEKIPGWAEGPDPDGSMRIRKALVVAAGLQPVKQEGNKEIVFEREDLPHRRCLDQLGRHSLVLRGEVLVPPRGPSTLARPGFGGSLPLVHVGLTPTRSRSSRPT